MQMHFGILLVWLFIILNATLKILWMSDIIITCGGKENVPTANCCTDKFSSQQSVPTFLMVIHELPR